MLASMRPHLWISIEKVRRTILAELPSWINPRKAQDSPAQQELPTSHVKQDKTVRKTSGPVHQKVLEDGVFLNGELAGYCHLMANAKAHLFLFHHRINGKFRPVVHASWAFAWHMAEYCMAPSFFYDTGRRSLGFIGLSGQRRNPPPVYYGWYQLFLHHDDEGQPNAIEPEYASELPAEVRHDVLPFCVMDDVLLVDRVRGHVSTQALVTLVRPARSNAE
ncbi:unnamed protein product [Symbiodinium sp. CCMP2456]|nr:unnamed protein product [Symbiodinium sp. CCMP2456]